MTPGRQFTPIASAVASELTVEFRRPTLPSAILTAAFLIPSAALAAVTDDTGVIWQRANITTEHRLGRLEVWYRPGGEQRWRDYGPFGVRLEVVPAAAGVQSVTSRICAGLVLQIKGMAAEYRRHTKIGDAVQAQHNALVHPGWTTASRQPRQRVEA